MIDSGIRQPFCTAALGDERGGEVMELVERTIGGPCPCKAGRECPLALGPRPEAKVDAA